MDVKCTLCGEKAHYLIKNTLTGYCKDHALECFGDTSYLYSVEEEVKRLKAIVEKSSDQLQEIKENLDKDSKN